MKADIHDYSKGIRRELDALERAQISENNRKTIKRFYDDNAIQGLSKPRLIKLVLVMRNIAGVLGKDFEQATIDDVKAVVRDIEQREWKPWTKMTNKIVLKKFYKWLKGNNEDNPPEVKWIKTTLKTQEIPILSQQELISEDEADKAIQKAVNPRDKAFVAVISESGCRIGEIGNLVIKNVTFDDHGTVLTVTGKTGPRRVRIIKATPHLATWINCHPFRDDPEAPLWVNLGATRHHEPMKYNGLAKVIKEAFKAAGIKKRCHPHLFRHSRASVMANHLTEFQMNHYFGWIQGSDMPSTYVHLSGKDLDGAILKMNGFQQPETAREESKPKRCPRCEAINAKDSKYCTKCAATLDASAVIAEQKRLIPEQIAPLQNNMVQDLLKDPAVQRMLVERMFSTGMRGLMNPL